MTDSVKRSGARWLSFLALVLMSCVFTFAWVQASNSSHIAPFNPNIESNIPVWNSYFAKHFPNCHNIDSRPDSVIPDRIVAVNLKGDARDYSFDNAEKLAHNSQIFVVGYCK